MIRGESGGRGKVRVCLNTWLGFREKGRKKERKKERAPLDNYLLYLSPFCKQVLPKAQGSQAYLSSALFSCAQVPCFLQQQHALNSS